MTYPSLIQPPLFSLRSSTKRYLSLVDFSFRINNPEQPNEGYLMINVFASLKLLIISSIGYDPSDKPVILLY